MIKPNELRIGNLVYFKGVLNKVIAVWISKEDSSKSYFHCEPIDDKICDNPKIGFHGIPLTEEWLVKFGFGRVDGNEFNIITGMTIFRIEERFELGNHDFPIELKYVHQLQNLHFALTGNELELKNK